MALLGTLECEDPSKHVLISTLPREAFGADRRGHLRRSVSKSPSLRRQPFGSARMLKCAPGFYQHDLIESLTIGR
eukprot:9561283-Alexandrium_andersonii.AAC.1